MELQMRTHLFVLLALLMLFPLSCKRGPKVISKNADSAESASAQAAETGIFSNVDEGNLPPANEDGMHQVEVLEALPTSRYVYLRVKEGEHEYWIATSKQEVNVGEKYFYKSGIFKRNFKSTEHNRVFEELYLVSSIVPADHSKMMTATGEQAVEMPSTADVQKMVNVPGSIKIAELVARADQYAGKEVQVSGLCTKVNPNIMDRNWIHLKDGSKDDYDFVVTSSVLIPEGHVVTLKGTLAVNKDFGAGYRYEVIVENAEIVNPQ